MYGDIIAVPLFASPPCLPQASPDEVDALFARSVVRGGYDAVKATLESGANVNGHSGLLHTPMVSALLGNRPDMVDFLLEQGADPDRPVRKEGSFPGSSNVGTTTLGERALHIAARCGHLGLVRVLLKRGRTDADATDSRGYTPLLVTCSCEHVCMGVVRLLLDAGADAALAAKDGNTPLHVVALSKNMDLVDMLHSRAPATLNGCNTDGLTPLYVACMYGNESLISKLRSLGATQPMPFNESSCPLGMAVRQDFVGVVRVLVLEGGVRAVGGKTRLAVVLQNAVGLRRARILRLLLMVDGLEGRSQWANLEGMYLLHDGAGWCSPDAVSVLLEAGADEAVRDASGQVPLEVIGLSHGRDKPQLDRGEKVAIRRTLQRGPAYRARSWAWPSDTEEADAGGSGDGDTAAAAAAAVLSSPPAKKTRLLLVCESSGRRRGTVANSSRGKSRDITRRSNC